MEIHSLKAYKHFIIHKKKQGWSFLHICSHIIERSAIDEMIIIKYVCSTLANIGVPKSQINSVYKQYYNKEFHQIHTKRELYNIAGL